SDFFNLLFFFFQAEDGIRDLYVTGVQTCALPISPRLPDLGYGGRADLAEMDGEERVEERRRGDERGVGALPNEVLGALDGRDPTDGEHGAFPRPRPAPGEHLLHLARRDGKNVGPDD